MLAVTPYWDMARRTSKNQLSSPQAGVEADGVEKVRTRLAELGITETDVAEGFRPFKASGSQRVTNEQINLMRDQIGF